MGCCDMAFFMIERPNTSEAIMGIIEQNMSGLPSDVQKKFRPYLKQLVDILGDRMVAVYLYGSVTGDGYSSRRSDINSVVVLRSIDIDILSECLVLVHRGNRQRIDTPLFLTEEHIRTSLDVFPLEFSEMKMTARLVYGHDLLKDLVVEDRHTRLLCEQQIKGKLLHIRQAYLSDGLRQRGIERVLTASMKSLLPVFRALLRLKGAGEVHEADSVVRVCQIFGLDREVFETIYRAARGLSVFQRGQTRSLFGRYMIEVEKLAREVDRI